MELEGDLGGSGSAAAVLEVAAEWLRLEEEEEEEEEAFNKAVVVLCNLHSCSAVLIPPTGPSPLLPPVPSFLSFSDFVPLVVISRNLYSFLQICSAFDKSVEIVGNLKSSRTTPVLDATSHGLATHA